MSAPGHDLVRDGFFARTRSEELKCPDLELNVLVSEEDVTGRVLGAIGSAGSSKRQNERRKAEIARIEEESFKKTGLRSEVVELYQGGEYRLYHYRNYTDVRLVMAPEQQTAFFGGNLDNFTYPRFALEIAIFRVYAGGKPLRSDHYFRLSTSAVKEGDLVFVAGHPWSTQRAQTLSQLEFQRDFALKGRFSTQTRRVAALDRYAKRGVEQEKRSRALRFGFNNALKLTVGERRALESPSMMEAKKYSERELRARIDGMGTLSFARSSWGKIAHAQTILGRRYRQIAHRNFFGSRLAEIATTIVRYVEEIERPNENRFEEFREGALESLKHRLFSPAPIYPDLAG